MRDELIKFLKGLGLDSIIWGQARALAVQVHGNASPTIEQIIDAGMGACQVIVVLMTPDEWVIVKPEYAESEDEKTKSEQGRPNVVYEAGLARGKYPDRTVIVEAGASRIFSDLHGVHRINLRLKSGKNELKLTLGQLCDVNEAPNWERVGDFSERFHDYYQRWRERGHGLDFLLDVQQLERLKRAEISNANIRKQVYAYALTSAIQHGGSGDVPYWIEKNQNSKMAALAMIDCIVLQSSLEIRLRAAKSLECMDPAVVEQAVKEYSKYISDNRRPRLTLTSVATRRGVTEEVRNHRAPVEGLANHSKIALLNEFETYPEYRGFRGR
jgi:hypothetical protein